MGWGDTVDLDLFSWCFFYGFYNGMHHLKQYLSWLVGSLLLSIPCFTSFFTAG